eukprot:3122449-Pyramimonas_sp.AAC.1
MRGALQAAARTDWRPIHPQMRAGRPSDGHAPMDVDSPRNGRDSHADLEGVGMRPPQGPPP